MTLLGSESVVEENGDTETLNKIRGLGLTKFSCCFCIQFNTEKGRVWVSYRRVVNLILGVSAGPHHGVRRLGS